MQPFQPLGAASAAVWTRRDAGVRLSRTAIDARIVAGTWQRVLAGTYTDGGHTPDAVQLAWAAVLATGDDSVVCGRSAARLWGLPLIDDDDPCVAAEDRLQHDVAVSRNLGPLSRGGLHVVNRRQLVLTESDVVVHGSGLVVTTAVRTLRDLAAVLSPEALQCAVDHGLRTGLVAVEELELCLEQAKGSRHVRTFRAAVERADAGAESPAETLARLILLADFPQVQTQVEVRGPSGVLVAVLDLALEEIKLAMEVDGRRNHAGPAMVAKDRARDRRTEELGWHTERVTWYELRTRPWAFASRVRRQAERLRAARS